MKILKSYILIFCVLIIVAIIVLPLMLTQKFIIENKAEQINIEVKKEEIDYNVKYRTINLLHKQENKSENVELDEYLVNVVAAEMPVDYELEALKLKQRSQEHIPYIKLKMVKSMLKMIYVMIQIAAKHGYQKKKDLKDGIQIKKKNGIS